MEKRVSLRKTNQESVIDFNEKLDKGHNFVDYFFTIGVEPHIALKPWLYEASIDELNTTYKEHLSPKIINKFPTIEKKLLGIDDTLINHIFPLGFKLIEGLNEPIKEQIFSIILDNSMFSPIYTLKYVTCLIFYEPLINYYKIYEKYYDANIPFSNMNNSRISNNKNNSNNNLINLSINLDNNSTGKFVFNDNVSNFSTNTFGIGPLSNFSDIKNSIQPVFQGSTHGSNLRISDNSQKETNISSINNNNNNINITNIKNKNLERYYIPKCICLISLHPFITECKTILEQIYKYSKLENLEMPLEKIINNLILEVPVPPRGLYSIQYTILEKNLLLQNSRLNSLFYINFEFEKLFINFNIQQILVIFQYLMLGIKTVFFSSEIENLTPIILSSLVLLFPFKFPFPVVSVLPKESYNLIDNITPEVLGINERYYSDFFRNNDIYINDDLLVVNIDEQKLEQFPQNDKNKLSSIPPLPKKITHELMKKLKNYLSKIPKYKENGKAEENTLFVETIRNYFLEFQVGLLKNYPKYLNSDIYKHPTENPFNKNKFLKSVNSDDYDFYEKFIETQMFSDYLSKRMTPKNKKEVTEVLYFEEKILEHKGHNDKIRFLNSNAFNFKNKPYQVNKVNPNLNENILEFYLNEQNQKKLLLNGITIYNNSNEISILRGQNNNSILENKSLSFNYILFPKLNNEFFFKNEIKSYFLNLSLYDEIEVTNAELISKSHLNRVETQANEITNYIYLLWLKVWSNSFHYHDKKEQKYRYLQMMKIFEKINQHDMSLLSHIFQALIKSEANEDLIYHLYIKIIQSKLSPNLEIFNTVKTMIRKKLNSNGMPSSNDISKFLAKKNKITYNKDEVNIKNFRERTIKNIYDIYTITEKITFKMDEICANCKNKINIDNFQKNINNTNDGVIWAKCPFCEVEYFPKINIIFGAEINKNNRLKTSTSLVDIVVLYSPKTLYMNILDFSNIDIDNYKLNYNSTFWNLIYYFKLIGLPYDFILPYSENIFRPKKTSNHNTFKVKFSNTYDFINNNNNNIVKINNNNINKNEHLKIPNNTILIQKPNIPNNNQYNTIIHKIDDEPNKNRNIDNGLIKLVPKKIIDNSTNFGNINLLNLSLPPQNVKQKIVFNNNIINNKNNKFMSNIYNNNNNFKILTPVTNYSQLRVVQPQITKTPISTYNNYIYNNDYNKNYNYYNNANVIGTQNYVNNPNYLVNNNVLNNYNLMNSINTINTSYFNNNIINQNKRIIFQNPITYTTFVPYNK